MTDAQQKECLAVLLKADIFSAAGEMELASVLLDFSELRSFKKDEIIYSPQNPEKCIGVLIKGEARVTKDYVTMSVLHPGQQFGTVVLYHKTDYFVNTILSKTDCKVLFVKKEGVDRLLAHNRRFAVAYISYLSKRIYFLNEKIERGIQAFALSQKCVRRKRRGLRHFHHRTFQANQCQSCQPLPGAGYFIRERQTPARRQKNNFIVKED